MTGDVWRLFRGETLLGELTVTDGNWPWLNARFSPQPSFSDVQTLFEDERAACERLDTDASDESVAAWEAVYERIRSAIRLTYPDGRNVPEFLLHIQGDTAWWRWSDEPFEETAKRDSPSLD